MTLSFIFGKGQQYETPEELARAQAAANKLSADQPTPTDLGSGLNAIGRALLYRSMMGDIQASEKAGRESAAAAFNPIAGVMSGPGAFPPPPDASRVAQALAGNPALKPAPGEGDAARLSAWPSSAGGLVTVGNYVARDPARVDKRLTAILNAAAEGSPYKVEAFSGYRPGDPRFHGCGMATDIRLVDRETGKALPNYQNAQAFRSYEQFAQRARRIQMDQFPDLDKQFRWGGYFSGPVGKDGAADLMHFDLGGSEQTGMLGGSWAGGLTKKQRDYLPGVESIGMDVASTATLQSALAPSSASHRPPMAPQQPGNRPQFDLSRLPAAAGGTADTFDAVRGPTLPMLLNALQNPWLDETQRDVVQREIKRLTNSR